MVAQSENFQHVDLSGYEIDLDMLTKSGTNIVFRPGYGVASETLRKAAMTVGLDVSGEDWNSIPMDSVYNAIHSQINGQNLSFNLMHTAIMEQILAHDSYRGSVVCYYTFSKMHEKAVTYRSVKLETSSYSELLPDFFAHIKGNFFDGQLGTISGDIAISTYLHHQTSDYNVTEGDAIEKSDVRKQFTVSDLFDMVDSQLEGRAGQPVNGNNLADVARSITVLLDEYSPVQEYSVMICLYNEDGGQSRVYIQSEDWDSAASNSFVKQMG